MSETDKIQILNNLDALKVANEMVFKFAVHQGVR